MENIVKILDIKFKLMTVTNRYYKTKIERVKETEYTQSVKDISKILQEIYNLKIKAIEQKVQADENQEDIDVWNQEMQSKTLCIRNYNRNAGISNGKIKIRQHRQVSARG